jgi:S-adenosylmethionine:tRNA-ribosyltransferase-isomerase (queuine synthetase)
LLSVYIGEVEGASALAGITAIPGSMKRQDFEFVLPERLIALRPTPEREAARLLVVHPDGSLEHRQFRDLPDFLKAPDILVVNDSRVLPAQLLGIRLPRQDGGPAPLSP